MIFKMKSKGFTLIEILIAMVFLSVALLALGGLMVYSTKNNAFSGGMTEAATFAQDKLEELRALSWVSVASGADQKTGSAAAMNYARNWNVVPNAIPPSYTEPTLKTVTITVNWNDKINHSISLTSLIVNPDPK